MMLRRQPVKGGNLPHRHYLAALADGSAVEPE